MPSFDGHFFQRTSMPLSPLPIEATGEFVFDLDPDRDGDTPFTPEAFAASPDLAYGINGALDVSIPFLKFFEFGFPLGDASAAIQVSEDDVRAAFSGLVTDDEFLPGLPVPIRPTGGSRSTACSPRRTSSTPTSTRRARWASMPARSVG
ncbi:MAG: hypothetical protein R3E53_02890 [Myxococcota bacterium]